MSFELLYNIDVKCTLGEGILWDDRAGELLWSDIQESKLYRWSPGGGDPAVIDLPERLGSFGLMEQGSRLICAFESGFALFDPKTKALDWLARPEIDVPYTRFNDGRVDRQGRFWAGTMVEGDSGEGPFGHLYCLDAHGNCTKHEKDIQIPNSTCWSPDSTRMYFSSTPDLAIRSYDFDAEAGSISNRQVFAEVTDAGPDGSTVDSEGAIWNAQWAGFRVQRYLPDGSPDARLDIPASQAACPCFAGPDLTWIAVSTARENLSDEALTSEPDAGNVFIYSSPFKGLPESRFKWHG